jgi:hypothetical protein
MIKLIVKATILVLLVLFWFWFRRKQIQTGKRFFDHAMSLEDSAEHEDACYHYALAAFAGYEPRLCRTKIRELWSSHGPFDFSVQLQRCKSESAPECQSCAEGSHYLTVRTIRRWLE